MILYQRFVQHWSFFTKQGLNNLSTIALNYYNELYVMDFAIDSQNHVYGVCCVFRMCRYNNRRDGVPDH